MEKTIENKRKIIKNHQELEEFLTKNKSNINKLYEIISDESIIIDESFDASNEYEGLYPHAILKPSQSGLDTEAIAYEISDNSMDANCTVLEHRFITNENGSVDWVCSDDGDGIAKNNIKKAISYGGYLGPKDVTKSGKYLEGLSNSIGCASDITDIYTNNGQGWYKVTVNFGRLKKMIKIYEADIIKLEGKKKDIFRGIVYKYMVNDYIEEPIKLNDIESIKHIINNKIIEKNKGTIIIFRNCHQDIVGAESLEEDFNNLSIWLGRRYWIDIDNNIEINIIKDGGKVKVKSIDLMMRNENSNYRKAFNTKYFELEKIFKVSEFTKNIKDNDYLSVNVSIKEKTDLYIDRIPKRNKKTDIDKILVPNILAHGIENQGFTIVRNDRPISDHIKIGLTLHNNYNGINLEICVDGRMDDSLFVTGDKSSLSERKLRKVFKDKLNFIVTQAYKVKSNKQEAISYTNADGDDVKVYPNIINNKFLEDEKIDIDNEDEKIDVDNEDDNSYWVSGIVFAATHKSEFRRNNYNNEILYEKNNKKYLVFTDKIDEKEGIRIRHLNKWWAKNGDTLVTLDDRIMKSIEKATFQKQVLTIYKNQVEILFKDGNAPALLPEVELYHNSYTNKKNKNYDPQRMDFCLILPNSIIIVLEIDGIQHIGNFDEDKKIWIASEDKYSEQCIFDNNWKLAGNEIYRISNKIFKSKTPDELQKFIKHFFIDLFKKHNILE